MNYIISVFFFVFFLIYNFTYKCLHMMGGGGGVLVTGMRWIVTLVEHQEWMPAV